MEKNRLPKEVNWPFESSLNSFLFDSETRFRFNRKSFLNCDHLKDPPQCETPFDLEEQYGDRLDVLKRKLALGGTIGAFGFCFVYVLF
jgi:hypothetical protein